jgi:ribosome-associated heat shock protein Hsp15
LDRSAPPVRLDKWLWHARFFRTRGAATRAVAEGVVRLNGARVSKPAHPLRPGDTLTFVLGGRVRVIRVRDQAVRRGAAEAARLLYDDLDDPAADAAAPTGPGDTAASRPGSA